MRTIRAAYPERLRLYWIQDNLSCHLTPASPHSPRNAHPAPFDGSSEKPHSRQTYRIDPSSSAVMPIVTPQAGQIGGRSSSASAVFSSSTEISLAGERDSHLPVPTPSPETPRRI